MEEGRLFCALFAAYLLVGVCGAAWNHNYTSAIGDPGMRRDGLRVAIESWNQCNEVGGEAPYMGSPRMADCFVLVKFPFKVHEWENKLGTYNKPHHNVDWYASWKELYLGKKCEVLDFPKPWQFWMIMLKSGNMDTMAAACPRNGMPAKPFRQTSSRFPCFAKGCMNMPSMYHAYTSVHGKEKKMMRGSFYGSWDLNVDVAKALKSSDASYYSVTWEKEVGKGSWVFHHLLKSSSKYPWLMLYLRSDATRGFSGGYHYKTRGMSKIVRFTLDVKQGGGPNRQFYLMDIESCWKNNGKPCNGDVTTDVTRYSEMIINPETESWCKPDNLNQCPPWHTFANGTRVHRNETARFPYDAYHLYCSPGNAKHLGEPMSICDPYSNPQPQEIMQILPHEIWGEYGYPTQKGDSITAFLSGSRD